MTGGVDFNAEADPVINGQVEGKFLDDNTYACIFRYDLAQASKDYTEYNEKYNEMTQQVLDEMGVTQDDLNDETDEGYALLKNLSIKYLSVVENIRNILKILRFRIPLICIWISRR